MPVVGGGGGGACVGGPSAGRLFVRASLAQAMFGLGGANKSKLIDVAQIMRLHYISFSIL